jgi:hypothetical protein
MLSVPLGQVFPADFVFGGYPLTWVRTFTSTEVDGVTKGGWVTARGNNREAFTPGEGFVIFLDKDEGDKDNPDKGLKLLGNNLELPYFEEHNVKVNHAHDYFGGTGTGIGRSWFYNFEYDNEKEEYVRLSGNNNQYSVDRTEAAYQLTKGDVITTPEFADGHFALIGNPFMAPVNFKQLVDDADNSKTINTIYHIWTGVTYDAYSSIDGYLGDDTANPLNDLIAPLQGFIVEKAFNMSNTDVEFKESWAKVNNGAGLRSAVSAGNRLNIIARNPVAGVRTIISKKEGGQNEFGRLDARKLMNEISDAPEIYTLKPNKGSLTAAVINVINSDEMLIPVGLATKFSGNITLSFSGMDSYDATLILIDAVANKEIDLTGLPSCDYTFNYTPKKNVKGEPVACEDRFFIRILKSVTDIPQMIAEKVNVFVSNGFVQVISGTSNPLKEVSMYDMQGALIYKADAKGAISHIIVRNRTSGAYIVRVVSERGVDNVKVVVR